MALNPNRGDVEVHVEFIYMKYPDSTFLYEEDWTTLNKKNCTITYAIIVI